MPPFRTPDGQWAMRLCCGDHKTYNYIKDNRIGIEIVEEKHVFCPVRLTILLLELRGCLPEAHRVMTTCNRIQFDGDLGRKYLFIQQTTSNAATYRVSNFVYSTSQLFRCQSF